MDFFQIAKRMTPAENRARYLRKLQIGNSMTGNGLPSQEESKQLISALFSLLPVPVAIADEEGRIALANSSFSEVFREASHIAELPAHEIDVPEQGTYAIHLLPLNNDGYRIVYVTDVTMQRQLGIQLEQLERMASVGRAVMGIGEDLKNPLTDIAEYGSMAEKCRMDAAARRIFEVVVSSADRAAHLVQSLMVVGIRDNAPAVPLDLNEMVRRVIERRRPRHKSWNIDVMLTLDSELPKAAGIFSQIEQVIASLVIHAEDAISDDPENAGWIRVQTGIREGRVQIQVSDNGKSRMTAPIFTSAPDGVGLNICGQIAREHGGELYAWSAYGGGSIYTLELPSIAPAPGDGIDSIALQRRLHNMTMLVVNDDVQVSEFVAEVLSRHGAHVQISVSGAEAYDRVYSTEYGLIICNYLMLGLSGENLFHLVQSTSRVNPRFLFLNSDVISHQARKFYVETGVPYLRKPFRIRDLVEAVEDVFNRSQPLGF